VVSVWCSRQLHLLPGIVALAHLEGIPRTVLILPKRESESISCPHRRSFFDVIDKAESVKTAAEEDNRVRRFIGLLTQSDKANVLGQPAVLGQFWDIA
jgi:hypothetical protein